MTAISQTGRRKDAQRNRDAILAAARELFSDCDDVPMYEIARRAGVGQATLYRNFPDRRDLVAALLEERMDRIERLAAEHAKDPDAFFVLLRDLSASSAYAQALSALAREDVCLGSRLDECRQRLAEIMKRPLRAAKAAGTLRRDVTIEDVFLVLWMVRGAMERVDGPDARTSASNRALALVLDGLTPPGSAAARPPA